MQKSALASKYRPQVFADVLGQDLVKMALSCVCMSDNVAPAYLFSGTRGVGKTSLARIFAKTLNCVEAPVAEPCNVCMSCTSIVQGSHVDVLEIDGASNRGIDDARRLRESIQLAPLQGRYKVIIIDEAHMLTKESFNALLKTLEEPPKHTCFILATTEAHKFPATILSRCQHFVLQSVNEESLFGHLQKIVQAEDIQVESGALRILARRASGSVRDALSLFGQALSLEGKSLSEKNLRKLLGLAGQEVFEGLLLAASSKDPLEAVKLCRSIVSQGLDVGFFLRELSTFLRNALLLKESKSANDLELAQLFGISQEEFSRMKACTQGFDRAYLHAAWQMVLDRQDSVLKSLEPPTSLELLLINLVLLKDLVSLELFAQAAISENQAKNEVLPLESKPKTAQIPQEQAQQEQNTALKEQDCEEKMHVKPEEERIALPQLEEEEKPAQTESPRQEKRQEESNIQESSERQRPKQQTQGQLKAEMNNHPTVQRIKENFNASLLHCYPQKNLNNPKT